MWLFVLLIIGGIVDRHCLNFLFVLTSDTQRNANMRFQVFLNNYYYFVNYLLLNIVCVIFWFFWLYLLFLKIVFTDFLFLICKFRSKAYFCMFIWLGWLCSHVKINRAIICRCIHWHLRNVHEIQKSRILWKYIY
jgi:hypothetical protein